MTHPEDVSQLREKIKYAQKAYKSHLLHLVVHLMRTVWTQLSDQLFLLAKYYSLLWLFCSCDLHQFSVK